MPQAGLRYTAGGLAVAVAAIHIFWGFGRLVTQLQIGAVADPRPVLFVASGAAIFIGIAQILDGRNPKPIYLAGIGLMIAYIGGFVAWHTLLGHGGFWPWGPDPITHDQSAMTVVMSHLLADRLALVSKLLEIALAGVLVVLYTQDSQSKSTDETIAAVVNDDA